jgi:hypothetical protein
VEVAARGPDDTYPLGSFSPYYSKISTRCPAATSIIMAGEEGKEGTGLSFPQLRSNVAQTPEGGSRLFRHSLLPRCLALVGVSHDISALSALILGIKAGTTHHSTKRRTPFVSVGTERTDEKERVERLFKDDGGRRGKAADDTVHCRFAVKTYLHTHCH